jgi:hypothetical protein
MPDYYNGTSVKNAYEAPLSKYRHVLRFTLDGVDAASSDPAAGWEDTMTFLRWLASTDATTEIAAIKADLDADYDFARGL